MIHKKLVKLCKNKHDTVLKSIIKANNETYHFNNHHFKNSLLSCYIEIEALINVFLRNLQAYFLYRQKKKSIPTYFLNTYKQN